MRWHRRSTAPRSRCISRRCWSSGGGWPSRRLAGAAPPSPVNTPARLRCPPICRAVCCLAGASCCARLPRTPPPTTFGNTRICSLSTPCWSTSALYVCHSFSLSSLPTSRALPLLIFGFVVSEEDSCKVVEGAVSSSVAGRYYQIRARRHQYCDVS
jgi:hypothetical protein